MSDTGWSLPSTLQTVAFGVPIADALLEATQRLSARRLAVVTTNSLAGSGGLAEVVRNIPPCQKCSGVKAGASHGMGHALGGTAGMPHGETSCVMLPHVLRYNASVNGNRQAVIAASVGSPTTPLSDIVAALISRLGLPTRIRDTGVSERVMAAVAEAALHDPLLASNPRPIKSLTDVRLLLEQAW